MSRREDSFFSNVPPPPDNYENTEMIYEIPGGLAQSAAPPKAEQSNLKSRPKKICVFFGIIMLLLVAVTIFTFLTYLELVRFNSPAVLAKAGATSSDSYKSCLEVFKAGFNQSGIYTITTTRPKIYTFEVYCDMKSAGGGWTLVASVVNEKPFSRCAWNDQWSARPGYSDNSQEGRGSSRWENDEIFGQVASPTESDFKSRAYVTLEATDLMVSHVPRGLPIDEVQSSAIYTYYTTGHFLKNYGSTLAKFFYHHLPLNSLSAVGADVNILNKIKRHMSITSLIPSWSAYSYVAGTSGDQIKFGGNNIIGNEVFFSVNEEPFVQIAIGRTYTDSRTYHMVSAAIHPFVVLATINNLDGYPTSFKLKVRSDFSSSSEKFLFHISETYKGMQVYAKSYEVVQKTNPTCLSVFFCIAPKKTWNSANCGFRKFAAQLSGGNFTAWMNFSGNMRNTLVGYTLLTQSSSSHFQSSEILIFFKALIDLIVGDDVRTYHNLKPTSFPVYFEKGFISYPNRNVTSGFIQFRAYDALGYVYAMCPGVKVKRTEDSSLFCVGSSNSAENDRDRCGDFSAWYKLGEHVLKDRMPNKKGRFVNDLDTSILLFTKNSDEKTTN